MLPQAARQLTTMVISKMEPAIIPAATIEESFADLEIMVHVTVTPPLTMVEGIEWIQGVQHFGLQLHGCFFQAGSFKERNGLWRHVWILGFFYTVFSLCSVCSDGGGAWSWICYSKGIAISTGIDAGSAMAFLRPRLVEVMTDWATCLLLSFFLFVAIQMHNFRDMP